MRAKRDIQKQRESHVNRPFYAIGLLLVALAGAMLLVGSGSKRQPTHPAANRGNGGLQTVPTSRGGVYVFVLPADEPVSERFDYAHGCGLDRTTGEVYAAAELEQTSAAEKHYSIPADCLAHYDADYDTQVYGVARLDREPRVLDVDAELELLEELDPSLRLFRELTKEKPEMPRRPRVRRNRLAEMAVPEITRPSATPTWQDYQEWANMQHSVAEQHSPAEGLPPDSARTGWQMVQFAAAALNHVAELLHAAAAQLEQSAEDELAIKPGDSAGDVGLK